jgi:hypothetical protein
MLAEKETKRILGVAFELVSRCVGAVQSGGGSLGAPARAAVGI